MTNAGQRKILFSGRPTCTLRKAPAQLVIVLFLKFLIATNSHGSMGCAGAASRRGPGGPARPVRSVSGFGYGSLTDTYIVHLLYRDIKGKLSLAKVRLATFAGRRTRSRRPRRDTPPSPKWLERRGIAEPCKLCCRSA